MEYLEKEIDLLRRKIQSASGAQRAIEIENLKNLMELSGWEPPSLAESVSTLETNLKTLIKKVEFIQERLGITPESGS